MSWFLSALVGAATGVLSGFGVGGGTLLLLWLTLVQGMDQFQAGGVNLVYFAACALPALWGHLRRGLVDRPTAPVSYTHLDVYKRQMSMWSSMGQMDSSRWHPAMFILYTSPIIPFLLPAFPGESGQSPSGPQEAGPKN